MARPERPWPPPQPWDPGSAGPSASRSPGTCRWSSSGPDGAGGSATPATGAGAACVPGTWPATRSRRRRHGGRRSRPGRHRSSRTRSGPTGTPWRCSTSSTSWSTVGRSGRPARSVGPNRHLIRSGASRSSSALITRSTTRWTSTSTRPSRSWSCTPSSSSRGSATCSPRSPSTIRTCGPWRRRGSTRHGRSVGPCPTTSAARPTTPSTSRTGTASRT
jgi:hypothetical protein